MNKNLLLIGGLILAGAIGAFLLLKKPASDTMMGSGMPTSFAQLMAMGQDYSCTFESTDEAGVTNSGTVYVAEQGNKFNGDFMMKQADGTETQSHMIRSGEYTYMWTSDQAQGYKMKLDPADDQLFPEGDEGEDSQVSFDENQEMNFNCQPWRPDNSMFTPPSNIEFVDLSAQMEVMQEQMEQLQTENGNNCALCDQVPAGESRTQCLTSLGC